MKLPGLEQTPAQCKECMDFSIEGEDRRKLGQTAVEEEYPQSILPDGPKPTPEMPVPATAVTPFKQDMNIPKQGINIAFYNLKMKHWLVYNFENYVGHVGVSGVLQNKLKKAASELWYSNGLTFNQIKD